MQRVREQTRRKEANDWILSEKDDRISQDDSSDNVSRKWSNWIAWWQSAAIHTDAGETFA